MADILEILVVARDNASRVIDAASDRIDRRLDATSVKAAAQGSAFERSGAQTTRAMRDMDRATVDAERDTDKFINTLRTGSRESRTYATSQDTARSSSQNFTRSVRDLEISVGRLIARHREHNSVLAALTPNLRNIVGDVRRFGDETDITGRRVSFFQTALLGMGRAGGSLTGVLGGLGGALNIFGRALGAAGGGPRVVFWTAAIAAGIPTVTALSAGVVGLASSLASLSAVAVTIPAAIGGMLGAMASITTVIKPALSGILEGAKALEAARAVGTPGSVSGTGSTGGGGGGAGTAVAAANAERALQQQRQQNAIQIADIERNLRRARADAIRQEKVDEEGVARARYEAVQRVIQAERDLARVRAENSVTETQLEASLADARASAEAERLRGGGHAELAQGLVTEAQTNLSTFRIQARAQEADAQQNVQDAQVAGVQQILDAERTLANTRRTNLRQITDLERQLRQTRLQNAQQEAAAVQNLQQANTAAGGSAAALTAQQAAWQNLSPVQQRIARELVALKDRWNQLTAAQRALVLTNVQAWLDALSARLPALARLTGDFTTALLHVSDSARRAFNNPATFNAFQDAMRRTARQGTVLGDAVVRIGVATIRFMDLPAVQGFLTWVANLSTGASQFVLNWVKAENALERTGRQLTPLQRFFNQARDSLQILGAVLRDTFLGLLNILFSSSAVGAGHSLLSGMAELAKRFRDFTDSAQGQSAIKRYFQDAMPIVRELLHDVSALIGFIAGIARTSIEGGNNGGFVRLLRFIRTQVAPALVAAAKLVQRFVSAFGERTNLAQEITGIADSADQLVTNLAPFAAGSTHFFVLFLSAALDAANGLVKALNALGNVHLPSFLGGGGAGGGIGSALATGGEALVGGAAAGAAAIAGGKRIVGGLFGPLKDLRDHFGGAQKGKQELEKNMSGEFPGHAGRFRTALNSMVDRLKAFATVGITKAVGAMKLFAGGVKDLAVAASGQVIGALRALNLVLLENPWVIIALAVIALIAVLVLIVTHWDQTKRFLLRIWNDLRDAAGAAFGKIVDVVEGAWDALQRGIRVAWNKVIGLVKDHWQQILLFFAGPAGIALLILRFTGLWKKIQDGVKAAWNWIHDHVVSAFGTIIDYFTHRAPNMIQNAFSSIWDGAKRATKAAMDWIVGEIAHGVNAIIHALDWVSDHAPFIDFHIADWNPTGGGGIGSGGGGGGGGGGHGHAAGGIAVRAASGWIGNEAVGNIVNAVPGGLLHIVEGGHPEAVLSLDPQYRNRTLEIIAEVLRRLGIRNPTRDLFGAIARARAVAADLLPDESIFQAMAGGGISGGGALAKNSPFGKSVEALREAARIDRLNLRYVWGGSHVAGDTPPNGPFDCSSFVSHILQHVGLLNTTMVSGTLAGYGSAGLSPGIGWLANDGHVYMEALGKYYGTSSYNPGGGPGHLPYGIRSGFAQRHPSGFPMTVSDLVGDVTGGQSLFDSIGSRIAAGAGAVFSIGGRIFSSISDLIGWLKDKIPSFPSLAKAGIFGTMAKQGFDGIRNDMIQGIAHHIPFFDKGGQVLGRLGTAVPAVLHAGEWVLNRQQQGRVARVFGGWHNARDAIFDRSVPMPRMSYAAGGIATPPGIKMNTPGGRVVNQHVNVNTSSPIVDVDYVARVLEQRMEHAVGG